MALTKFIIFKYLIYWQVNFNEYFNIIVARTEVVEMDPEVQHVRLLSLVQIGKEVINKMLEFNIISSMDMPDGYYQTRLDEETRHLAAFSDGKNLWVPYVLPFGLSEAPAAFAKAIDLIIKEEDCNDINYFDDLNVGTKALEQHNISLRKFLDKLRRHKIYTSKKKSEFFKTVADILGFVVTQGKIIMQPDKLNGIREFPTPTTVKKLQSFLGMVNYYRDFVPNYSKIAAPLYDLTKNRGAINLNSNELEIFNSLKSSLLNAASLNIPDPSKPFEIHADASNIALGATIGQRNDKGTLCPIVFHSRKLTQPERNYSTTQRELLAIVDAITKYKFMLLNSKIIIKSDHKNLIYFNDKPDLSPRETRWALKLSAFDITIEHINGVDNPVADALSRREDYDNPIPEELVKKITNSEQVMAKEFRNRKDNVTIQIGELTYLVEGQDRRLIVDDPKVIQELICEAHDTIYSGHYNAHNTYLKLKPNYIFPSMINTINKYVNSCNQCQKNQKIEQQKSNFSHTPASRPWSTISMDFLKLPKSKKDKDNLLEPFFLTMSHREDKKLF